MGRTSAILLVGFQLGFMTQCLGLRLRSYKEDKATEERHKSESPFTYDTNRICLPTTWGYTQLQLTHGS